MLLAFILWFIVSATMLLPYNFFKRKLQNDNCFKQYLQYKTSLTKLDNCQLRISFLEKCRESDIIPKFLQFKIPSNGCFDQTSVHNFQKGLLVKEIGRAKITFSECQVRLNERRSILRVKVPYICCRRLYGIRELNVGKTRKL